MRSLLILIDGLGDDQIPAWQGKTPFEYAAHPWMDAVAASGGLGHCSNKILFPKAVAAF